MLSLAKACLYILALQVFNFNLNYFNYDIHTWIKPSSLKYRSTDMDHTLLQMIQAVWWRLRGQVNYLHKKENSAAIQREFTTHLL